MRTIKLVPPGMVTARAEKGVSKTQRRLKEKTAAYLIIFLMGFGTVIQKCGFTLRAYGLSLICGLNLSLRTISCAPVREQTQFMAFAWITKIPVMVIITLVGPKGEGKRSVPAFPPRLGKRNASYRRSKAGTLRILPAWRPFQANSLPKWKPHRKTGGLNHCLIFGEITEGQRTE